MAAAIVANGCGIFGDVRHQVFQRAILAVSACKGFVQVIHISLVMLVVVDLHCLRINVRLKGAEVVREWWE